MTQRKIKFTDSNVNENNGNLFKDNAKILDTDNASFADLQDVNIPTNLTQADDGKIIEAYYADPDVYGDESDGDLIVETDTSLDLCTDLITDCLQGSTTITVRSTTGFNVDDEIIIITSQIYRYPDVQSLGLHEYKKIVQILSSTQLLIDSGVNRNYLSDADGSKENNTKTQIVKIWNYNSVTLNANLTCKQWNGYSGGVLAFRAKTLLGTFNIDVSMKGYTGSGQSQDGEGYLGKKSVISGGARGAQNNDWSSGGGHLTSGSNGGNAFGLTIEQSSSNPSFGGSGNRYFFPDDSLKFSAPGSGIVISYIQNNSNFTGKVISAPKPIGNTSNKYNAGGTVVLYTTSGIPFTTDVDGATYGGGTRYGSVGRIYTGVPLELPTRYYQLGPKVNTVLDDTLDTEMATSKAIGNYVKDSLVTFESGSVVFSDVTADRYITNLDKGKILRIESASVITLHIPYEGAPSFENRIQMFVYRKGTGNLIVEADASVIFNGNDGGAVELEQYAVTALIRENQNEWLAVSGEEAIKLLENSDGYVELTPIENGYSIELNREKLFGGHVLNVSTDRSCQLGDNARLLSLGSNIEYSIIDNDAVEFPLDTQLFITSTGPLPGVVVTGTNVDFNGSTGSIISIDPNTLVRFVKTAINSWRVIYGSQKDIIYNSTTLTPLSNKLTINNVSGNYELDANADKINRIVEVPISIDSDILSTYDSKMLRVTGGEYVTIKKESTISIENGFNCSIYNAQDTSIIVQVDPEVLLNGISAGQYELLPQTISTIFKHADNDWNIIAGKEGITSLNEGSVNVILTPIDDSVTVDVNIAEIKSAYLDTITVSRSLVNTDAAKTLDAKDGVVLTIEAYASEPISIGKVIRIINSSEVDSTLTAASGVTLNGTVASSFTLSKKVYVNLICVAEDVWLAAYGAEHTYINQATIITTASNKITATPTVDGYELDANPNEINKIIEVSATVSRNITSTDIGKIIRCTPTEDITLTIPLDSTEDLDTFKVINILNPSNYIISIVSATGVLVNGVDGSGYYAEKNSMIMLWKIAANTWTILPGFEAVTTLTSSDNSINLDPITGGYDLKINAIAPNVIDKSSSFTLSQDEANATLICDSSSNVVYTIPDDATSSPTFGTNVTVYIRNIGSGTLTVAASSTTYLNGTLEESVTVSRYTELTLFKIGTDSWAGVVSDVAPLISRVEVLEKSIIESNEQTGSTYILDISDAGKYVDRNNASANTTTIPSDTTANLPIGCHVMINQLGAGVSTVVADAGVTLNGITAGSGDLNSQYSVVTLRKRAANTWQAIGDIGTIA